MMNNSHVENFTRKELADIYDELLLFYENNKGLSTVNFSTRSKCFKSMKVDIGLDFHELKKIENLNVSSNSTSFIWFVNSKSNQIKSTLYHLRNSAAHAHIKKIKSGRSSFYEIDHVFRNETKFKCRMKTTDFWHFVDVAKSSTVAPKKQENGAPQ
jgi:hypothetical protein